MPGKVFLVGEYLALAGLPAVLLSTPPRFRLRLRRENDPTVKWAAGSPIGRWLGSLDANRQIEAERWFFEDPYSGMGGFGASTAQFALHWFAMSNFENQSEPEGWKECWYRYRHLHCEGSLREAVQPSGADLASQLHGGLGVFENTSPRGPRFEALNSALESLHFAVFSAASKPGRKVATHEHLARLSERGELKAGSSFVLKLEANVLKLRRAVESRRDPEVGACMGEYADLLNSQGLEIAEAKEERSQFEAIDGVLGAKGAGALLSDAAVVLLDSRDPGELPKIWDRVFARADSMGLKCISKRIKPEPGIEFHV